MLLTSAVTMAVTACASPAAQLTAAGPSTASSPATAPEPSNAQRAGQQRPPGEKVPGGVTGVTLTLDPDMNVHAKPPKPVTINDLAKVRALVALVNGLRAFPAGAYNCPFDGGAHLVLTFRAGPAKPATAVATVALEGCEGVGLTIGAKQQPGLGAVDGGRQVAARALKAAGLNWNLPRYLA